MYVCVNTPVTDIGSLCYSPYIHPEDFMAIYLIVVETFHWKKQNCRAHGGARDRSQSGDSQVITKVSRILQLGTMNV